MWLSKTSTNPARNFQSFSELHPGRKVILTVSLALLGFGALLILLGALVPPWVLGANVSQEQKDVSMNSTVEIRFSHPPARRDITANIAPEIAGSWQWQNTLVGNHLARKYVFTPDNFFNPATSYTVSIAGVKSFFGLGRTKSYQLNFTTQNIPTIVAAAVAGKVESADPAEPITITLDSPNNDLAAFSFHFSPEVIFTTGLSTDKKTYTLTPNQPLGQGIDYTLYVEREILIRTTENSDAIERLPKEEIFQQIIKTRPAPAISSFSPQGSSVLPNISEIKIVFKEAMNRTSVAENLTITPSLAGSWQWQDDLHLNYLLSSNLSVATSYRVTLKKGALAQSASYLESDAVFNFTTVGILQVLRTTPSNKSTGNSINNSIALTFDQPVVHESVESKFSVSPTVNGQFSWQNDTVTFKPTAPLGYYQTYTVILLSGAKTVYGLDLNKDYSFSFTTEEKTVLLNIANDKQDHNLSCEFAALKMALAYKGVGVSEGDLIALVAFDGTPHVGSTWGNPNTGFVGDINGSQNTTGYGVHWGPIAVAANHYRSSKSFSGWGLTDLTREIDAGNPVVVWGVIGKASADSWTTPDGTAISAWKGEHARTLVGYRGNSTNPSTFFLNDPYTGSRLTWSAATLTSNWGSFGNSGVVIY